MTEAPQIYGLMAKALKMFGESGIKKTSTNSFQKFNYRSIDSTLAAANAVFAELGLFLTIEAESAEFTRVPVETAKGSRVDYTLTALYTVTFYAPDGSSVKCHNLPAANTGQDDSKLAGQVMSYILKEALFKTFLIPTVGNEDVDELDAGRNQPNNPATPPSGSSKALW
jgi:ERF superfamily